MPTRTHPTGRRRGAWGDPLAPDPRLDTPWRLVGAATHRAIGRLVEDPAAWSDGDLDRRASLLAGRLLAEHPEAPLRRQARRQVARDAAAYARWFLPPAGWTLLGSEVPLGDAGRVDVAWRTGDGEVVYDEVKRAATADAPSPSWVRQALRYAAHGRGAHGDAFAGVRLILLGAPRSSRLITGHGASQPLPGTALWFGPDGRATGGDR